VTAFEAAPLIKPPALRGVSDFVVIAKGSLMETETFLMLAVRLCYVTEEDASVAFGLITENSKMLTSLRNRLKEADK
jgi:four helix bundle protein